MDIIQLFNDFAIKVANENEKHYRDGWVNTPCPFCTGNPGNHLGYNLNDDYFFCWRCGHKDRIRVISKLLNIDNRKAKELIRQYKGGASKRKENIVLKRKGFKMPPMLQPISKNRYANLYFQNRGFNTKDILIIENKFNLQATSVCSQFDNLDLCYRVIAQIYFENKIVSWQSRDLTNKASLKYITCPKEYEIIDHKHILYNYNSNVETVILCEGIFDVWKVFLAGFNAVCCFGVEYTTEQLKWLMGYRKVLVFLDPDKAGKSHGSDLEKRLLFAGINCEMVKHRFKIDPGDMTKMRIRNILNPYFKEK